jgi:hypothetical protein
MEGGKEGGRNVLSTRPIDIIVALQDDRATTRGAGDTICVDLVHC